MRLAVEESTTAEVFEAYLEHSLAPELKEGRVVVMDNLPAHKPDRVRELIEDRGSANLCICRPTHRTTTPSRRPSPRSKECYGMCRLGRVGPC
jgi:transposase